MLYNDVECMFYVQYVKRTLHCLLFMLQLDMNSLY